MWAYQRMAGLSRDILFHRILGRLERVGLLLLFRDVPEP